MTERGPQKKWRRRLILATAAALLALWSVWQQESIVTETYLIPDGRLPPAFDGLRIAHLSDLHGKEFGAGSARLLKAVAALEPDLIALTGDLIDQAGQLEMLPALASGLSAIAPTYYVTGNHEWAALDSIQELKALLAGHGVTVLSGEYAVLERDGQTIALAGLDDPNGYADQTTGPQLKAAVAAGLGEDAYTILLSHRDSVDDYAPWGFDLTLCGHGHGGIFRIPIVDRGLLSTDRTFFPKYDGGLFQVDGGSYVVSRGLGSNSIPRLPIHTFRLFNRPHLPLIVLRAQG